jgi:amidase
VGTGIIAPHHEAREKILAASQWSFKSAADMSAALAAKKVSAVELAQDTIARIEKHDGKINAVCVRDFERGLEAA